MAALNIIFFMNIPKNVPKIYGGVCVCSFVYRLNDQIAVLEQTIQQLKSLHSLKIEEVVRVSEENNALEERSETNKIKENSFCIQMITTIYYKISLVGN